MSISIYECNEHINVIKFLRIDKSDLILINFYKPIKFVID